MKDVNRRSGSRLSWMIFAITLTALVLFASGNAGAADPRRVLIPRRGHAIRYRHKLARLQ